MRYIRHDKTVFSFKIFFKIFQGYSNYVNYGKRAWRALASAFTPNAIDRQFGLTIGPLMAFAAIAVVSGAAYNFQTNMDEELRDAAVAGNEAGSVSPISL